ncbi:YhcN/YlaJ family sporulation lipoprotein [Gracilibacillus marinus]|jgi:spore cortex protein|uniref:YhcN/YlaJ family sporulation lipoprotein n=1 Tax=Gracilibacillus marinus TaxID=630535 RepID=A0ABV8VUA3_9BACI
MKKNKHILALIGAATITLTACGANEYGQNSEEYNGMNNTRPIGYNQTSNDPMVDRSYNRNNIDTDTRVNRENKNMMERDRDSVNNIEPLNTDKTTKDKTKYEIAEKAQKRIEKEIPSIQNVYVLKTNNNAYVAASWDKDNNTTKNENELSKEVREKIVKAVKSVDNDIEKVYISTNPDFLNLVNQYSEDVDSGEPIEGLFNRMGNMIERVFPDNAS